MFRIRLEIANAAAYLVGIDVDLVSVQRAHRTITEHNLKTISFNVGDGYELVCQTQTAPMFRMERRRQLYILYPIFKQAAYVGLCAKGLEPRSV